MNGQGHALTTLAALDALPDWQRELWATERTKLAEEYSLYGDTYAGRKQELGPFVELPDGSVPDFYMPKLRWKHHCDAAIDYWESPFYDNTVRTLDYFSRRIVDAIRRKNITDAARYAGTMAHYVQDNACPGHAVDDTDLEIVKDLLPPPERLRRAPFHSMMELSPEPFALAAYVPRLHGTTETELAYNFIPRLVGMTLHARRTILPFFNCFYTGEQAKAVALNMDICRHAAEVFADYLYSVTSIAFSRFDRTAHEAGRMLRLSGAFPYRQTAWAGGSYSQLAPGELVGVNVNEAHEAVPCELLYRDESGSRAVAVPDALGSTAYYEYEFRVPRGSYRQLEFEYGIHARLGAKFPILFEVYCNESRLFCDEKRAGEPAGAATLPWAAEGERLRLITTVSDGVSVPRINGRPVAATGHAIWGKPRLLKTE